MSSPQSPSGYPCPSTRGRRGQGRRGRRDALADQWVTLHELPLEPVEGARLVEDRRRNCGLADVVKPRGDADPAHLVLGLAQRFRERAREL
jgi:hypothetical protein